MSSKTIYAYVYRITNIIENKHYYGKRVTKKHPSLDLGKKYFSSSTNDDFMLDQKSHPENYIYKVIVIAKSKYRAAQLEVKLHKKFNVASNPNFYNKCNARMNGFGMDDSVAVTVVETGERILVEKDCPKLKTGEYIHHFKDRATLRHNITGECINIKCSDPKANSELYSHVTKDRVVVKDKDGNTFSVNINDPRYISGELVYYRTGTNHKQSTKDLMSENGIRGKNVYHNPDTKEKRYFDKDEIIPDGFIKGEPEEVCLRQKERFTDCNYYHHPETNIQIRLKPHEEIPEGFIPGRNKDFVGFKFNYTTYRLLDLKDKEYKQVKLDYIPERWQIRTTGQKLDNIKIYVFDNKIFIGKTQFTEFLNSICILPHAKSRKDDIIKTGYIDISRYKNKTKNRINDLNEMDKDKLLNVYNNSYLREHTLIFAVKDFDYVKFESLEIM